MIVLITPTGARQRQFDLCTLWMSRQTYAGKVTWIIVDDAVPRTTNKVLTPFRDNWDIIKVYPTPPWQGQNTQARNIDAGIKAMIANVKPEDIEGIFIIEDDDYYKPIYLERMMANFGTYSLIGEVNTIYYNVHHRRYITNPNTVHASLFQTAFRYDAIPALYESFASKFIDCVLWQKVANKHLFYEHSLSVGIKGLPGRAGIGAGHSRAMNMRADPDLNYLRALIGDDTQHYAGHYGGGGVAHSPLFKRKTL